MSQEPFLHIESGTVRFWVSVNEELIGAMIRKETLHYSYHPHKQDDEPLETYEPTWKRFTRRSGSEWRAVRANQCCCVRRTSERRHAVHTDHQCLHFARALQCGV